MPEWGPSFPPPPTASLLIAASRKQIKIKDVLAAQGVVPNAKGQYITYSPITLATGTAANQIEDDTTVDLRQCILRRHGGTGGNGTGKNAICLRIDTVNSERSRIALVFSASNTPPDHVGYIEGLRSDSGGRLCMNSLHYWEQIKGGGLVSGADDVLKPNGVFDEHPLRLRAKSLAICGMRMDNVMDAIGWFTTANPDTIRGYLWLRDCWISEVRDDVIESDVNPGPVVVERCLLDNIYMGYSFANPNAPNPPDLSNTPCRWVDSTLHFQAQRWRKWVRANNASTIGVSHWDEDGDGDGNDPVHAHANLTKQATANGFKPRNQFATGSSAQTPGTWIRIDRYALGPLGNSNLGRSGSTADANFRLYWNEGGGYPGTAQWPAAWKEWPVVNQTGASNAPLPTGAIAKPVISKTVSGPTSGTRAANNVMAPAGSSAAWDAAWAARRTAWFNDPEHAQFGAGAAGTSYVETGRTATVAATAVTVIKRQRMRELNRTVT